MNINFVINSQVLEKKLQQLIGVVSTNKALPITQDFLIDLQGNNLTITATDLETTLKITLELANSNGEGKFTVPARPLLDFLKFLPDAPVTFNIDLEKLTIDINSNEGKYRLTGHNAEEFPELPEIEKENEFYLNSKLLRDGITKTVFATGNDERRPAINGVFFEVDTDSLTLVASDAHKLVKYTRNDANPNISTSFVVAKKPLNVLKNLLSDSDETTKISYNDKHICFNMDKDIIYARLIDARYPNYKAVIPQANQNKLVADRELLINSINRLVPFANQSTQQLVFTLSGQELVMEVEDIDYSNQGVERIECSYSGEDMKIAFSFRYLLELLSNLNTKNVVFLLGNPDRAGLIQPEDDENTDEDIVMVIMPLQIVNG